MRRRVIVTLSALGLGAAVAVIATRDPAVEAPAPDAVVTPAPPTAPAPAEAAVVSPPIMRTLETPQGRHAFEERLYTPEYPLARLSSRPPDAWLTSPEAVMSSLFSAMQAGDFAWAMSLFDDSDAEWRAQAERDRDKYLAAWPESFTPHRFFLVKRHVVSGYAVVYTRRDDRPLGHAADAVPYALRRDERGRWWLTHEIDAHPVKNLALVEMMRRKDHATP